MSMGSALSVALLAVLFLADPSVTPAGGLTVTVLVWIPLVLAGTVPLTV